MNQNTAPANIRKKVM
jgi:hypothetical protein